ncbi:recombinase family protein [Halogeometricum sp. S1BR25-6]|uniref:Recombinase family protein n=1 Tax=Halogeometricum salsisoli TaxID=2950536 RepID=A0ABU2G9V4_9EURY|nr:recombinase family protein [Halogeometricum sp. S1BR25-6]MDS0297539.1 recombinase family protein [Halogeometricum sp. S1BR25-6]
MTATAVYLRVSTRKQSTERQRREIEDYLNGDVFSEAEVYVDVASGANDSRPDFQRLREDVEMGDINHVVTYGMSRLSRRLTTTADFIDLCVKHEVALTTTNDGFPNLSGEGNMGDALIGKLFGWLMEFELQMIRERVQSGVNRAIEAGKWVGRPPYGFVTDNDGYLVIDMENYLAMQMAVETVLLNPEQSVNSIARAYGVPQSSLDRIYKDEERRKLYLYGDSDDERLSTAVGETTNRKSELSDLKERLAELEAKVTADE